MKKAIVLLVLLSVLLSAVSGCANSGNSNAINRDNQSGANPSNNKSNEIDLSLYKKPADAVVIDISKEDPSSDEMRFLYDEIGRIAQCYYKIDGQQVYVSYTYKDDSVHIYAFMNEVLTADELINVPDFNSEIGFSTIDGYYFKGFKK